MDNTILKSKTFIPPTKPTLVSRQRLSNKLDDALHNEHHLVFITASAGYGKTTLLSEWAEQTNLPVAWISLDKLDNDPRRFISSLIHSLDSVGLNASVKINKALEQQTQLPVRKLFLALINEIINFEQEFVLVFDDFHLLTNPAMLSNLCELITDMPTHMGMVISGRTMPDIPWAKLYAQNKILKIEELDLRFNEQEIVRYFQGLQSPKLSQEEILVIQNRTEGWVTALQLIGLTIENRQDVYQFIQGISNVQQTIEQFLIEEVLNKQNQEITEFLFVISHLERFNLTLITQVYENPTTAALFAQVLEKKLFIVPLDGTGNWYRFHHLFADLLRNFFRRRDTGQTTNIHHKAAEWFRGQEFWADAIYHDLQAKDYEGASCDIEKFMDQYWLVRDKSQILSWIEALPAELVHNNLKIGLFLAWTQFQSGEIVQGKLKLEDLKYCLKNHNCTANLDEEQKMQIEAIIAVQEAAYHCTFGDPKIAIEKVDFFQKVLSSELKQWVGVSWNAKGIAYRAMDKCDLAIQALIEAERNHHSTSNIYGQAVALSSLATQYYEMGQLHLAYETCQKTLSSIEQFSRQFIPLGMIYLNLAKVYLEWNEYSQAESYLLTSIDSFIEDGDLGYLLESYYQLARVRFFELGPQQALKVMALAELILREKNPPVLITVRFKAYMARILILIGDFNQAAVLMNTMDLNEEDRERFASAKQDLIDGRLTAYVVAGNLQTYSMKFEIITQSLILISQKQAKEALLFLDIPRVDENSNRCGIRDLELNLLEVIALSQTGDTQGGLAKLTETLQQTQAYGHITSYLIFGSSMKKLLRKLIEREKQNEDSDVRNSIRVKMFIYVSKLLSAFEILDQKQITGDFLNQAVLTLSDPLTPREEEVLQNLAKGLSYQEIGERLSVTENTVRTHIRGMYGKLGVNNRVLAITKAHDLGLIK